MNHLNWTWMLGAALMSGVGLSVPGTSTTKSAEPPMNPLSQPIIDSIEFEAFKPPADSNSDGILTTTPGNR